MIELLKNQLSLFNFLFVALFLCFALYFFKKIKWFKGSIVLWIISFLLVSTNSLPAYLGSKLENKYSVFNVINIDSAVEYHIVVLASGYNADQRLPGIGQLELVSLGRLAEAIRIKRMIPNSLLVCSGYSAFKLTSQATTTRKAAIELGINADEILIMETPKTTWEEAETFYKQFGRKKNVILVTDAIHMNRAMSFFKKFDLNVTPAPTNFKVRSGVNNNLIKLFPSISNIQLMNAVLHEYAGELKQIFFNKK